MSYPVRIGRYSGRPEQFVQARLGACLVVHALYDHGADRQSVLNGALSEPCGGMVAYDSALDIPCDVPGAFGSILIWQYILIGDSLGITSPGRHRLLTPGEKRLAKDNGMDINDIDQVRVHNGAFKILGFIPVFPNRVIAPNGHIYVGPGAASYFPWREDYAPLLLRNGYSDVQNVEQSILLHELTHVCYE